jgi:hypothetical protein
MTAPDLGGLLVPASTGDMHGQFGRQGEAIAAEKSALRGQGGAHLDPPAITNPDNFASWDHSALKTAADGVNAEAMHSNADVWGDLAKDFGKDVDAVMRAVTGAVSADWTGQGASQAQAATYSCAQQAGQLRASMDLTSINFHQAALAASATKNAMPKSVATDPMAVILEGIRFPGAPVAPGAVQAVVQANEETRLKAVHVMDTMYLAPYQSVDVGIPALPLPTDPTKGGAGGGAPGGGAGAAGSGASTTAPIGQVGGVNPAVQYGAGTAGSNAGTAGTSAQFGGSGAAPSGYYGGSGHAGAGSHGAVYDPASLGSSGGSVTAASAGIDPSVAMGGGVGGGTYGGGGAYGSGGSADAYGAAGGASGVGGAYGGGGGFGPGSGAGGGAGSSSGMGRGASSGVGGLGSAGAEGAGGRGVTASGAAGARGGSGMGGGGMGGGRGRGDDDYEHNTPSYLISEEFGSEIVGTLPPVSPAVIGG